jgi:hypothetical protein
LSHFGQVVQLAPQHDQHGRRSEAGKDETIAIDNDIFRPVTGQVDQPVGEARVGHGTYRLSELRDQDPPNCP